jgi:GNAT superfamily N-acetyltransferase
MEGTSSLNGLWQRDGYSVSSDAARLDLDVIHGYLSGQSYWARGIPRDTVRRAIAGSLCFGLFHDASGAQIGLARLVTDRATFAYLADVFVLDAHRGRGLSKWLMEIIIAHPELQGLRRWALATADAHGLYTRFGFKPLARPERFMERHFPDIYGSST